MEKVQIYDGITEEDLLQEIDDVKKEYNNNLEKYKKQKVLSGFGVAITFMNLLAFSNLVANKSLLSLVHGGYSIMCGITMNKNFKDLKDIKEKDKCLKLKLKSLEEKLPIEIDCVVK